MASIPPIKDNVPVSENDGVLLEFAVVISLLTSIELNIKGVGNTSVNWSSE